jgi:hypothetical protein
MLPQYLSVVGRGGGFRIAAGRPDQAGCGAFLVIQQSLQQMFSGDALVEFSDRNCAGCLEKSLAALGKLLDIHLVSLSSGDGPFMPQKEAT